MFPGMAWPAKLPPVTLWANASHIPEQYISGLRGLQYPIWQEPDQFIFAKTIRQ